MYLCWIKTKEFSQASVIFLDRNFIKPCLLNDMCHNNLSMCLFMWTTWFSGHRHLGQLPEGCWFKSCCGHLICIVQLDKALYVVSVYPAAICHWITLEVNLRWTGTHPGWVNDSNPLNIKETADKYWRYTVKECACMHFIVYNI